MGDGGDMYNNILSLCLCMQVCMYVYVVMIAFQSGLRSSFFVHVRTLRPGIPGAPESPLLPSLPCK